MAQEHICGFNCMMCGPLYIFLSFFIYLFILFFFLVLQRCGGGGGGGGGGGEEQEGLMLTIQQTLFDIIDLTACTLSLYIYMLGHACVEGGNDRNMRKKKERTQLFFLFL